MIVLGIDPGMTGAVAALDESGRLLWAERTPVVAGNYDLNRMVSLLHRERDVITALEDVGAARVGDQQQGSSAMFTFGEGKGLWKGMIAALALPRVDVAPQAWAALLKGMPRLAPCAKDATKEEKRKHYAASKRQRKENAANRALALWPNIELKFKADWPKADAALIAEYARRQHVGQKAIAQ